MSPSNSQLRTSIGGTNPMPGSNNNLDDEMLMPSEAGDTPVNEPAGESPEYELVNLRREG